MNGNQDRQIARRYFIESGGQMPSAEIARRIGRPASTVRKWKQRGDWARLLALGGPDDALIRAPIPAPRRQGPCAVPPKVRAIMDAAGGMDEREILWKVILFQYASIVRAQELMYVRDENDTRFLAKGEGVDGEQGSTYEPHAAWDRHASFMQAQSRAVAAFNSSLKAYQQLMVGVHTADARQQQAKLLAQKVKKLTESQSPEIHIHTQIPRPGEVAEKPNADGLPGI